MINFISNEGHTRLELHGSIIDIEADLCVLVKLIYDECKSRNRESGEQFKDFVRCFLSDAPFSTDFDVKAEKRPEKSINDEELFRDLKMLNKKLEELNNILNEMEND